MRRRTMRSSASALLLFATIAQAHKGAHEHLEALHKRHREHRIAQRSNANDTIEKRSGQCAFPDGVGLVPVTPGSANGGWAMSPDQPCTPGSYCPYACPPGEVSMQWDPSATTYAYPQSMNGGLYCDNSGQISKPFPDKPYCQSTEANIGVINNAGGTVAFCQTVLPGNEAMLIPTSVDSTATLAVPGTDYWAGTAAHYYINPPGTDAGTACVWGTNSNPWGNWSPFVAGANVDASGQTFIKLGWNPIYLEPTTPFRTTMPNWGVKIDCPNGGCNGLPCAIDPSNTVNQMVGTNSEGAGGGSFCVVTVDKGATANFVVYGGSSGKGGQFYHSWSDASASTTTSSISSSTTSSTTTEIAQNSTTSSSITRTTPSFTINANTTSKTGPTGQPYYNLFNTTAPDATGADAGAAASATIHASASIKTHTGDAASMSFSLFALAPAIILSLL